MDRRQLQALGRHVYERLAAGDLGSFKAAFAREFVWHVPGNNPASGAYRGADEYFRLRLERMAPLDEWSLVVNRVLGNESASAALVELELTGKRRGHSIQMTSHHLIRFNEAGKIVEAVGFVEDQERLDEFFRA